MATERNGLLAGSRRHALLSCASHDHRKGIWRSLFAVVSSIVWTCETGVTTVLLMDGRMGGWEDWGDEAGLASSCKHVKHEPKYALCVSADGVRGQLIISLRLLARAHPGPQLLLA